MLPAPPRCPLLERSGGREREGKGRDRRKREGDIFYRRTVDVRGVIELRWTNGKRSS
jgi:hypothetical protein